jgi:hypothetical protein
MPELANLLGGAAGFPAEVLEGSHVPLYGSGFSQVIADEIGQEEEDSQDQDEEEPLHRRTLSRKTRKPAQKPRPRMR